MSTGGASHMAAPILVAVRSPEIRSDICETLIHAGYQAHPAGDGLHALQLAQATEMKLVIADAQLRHIASHSLLDVLRRMPEYCFTPFVLFSDTPEILHPNEDPTVLISAWLFSPLDREHLIATVSCFVD